MKFPGKLFLMGEYAVVMPKQKSVVAAIDRFIYASIEQGDALYVKSSFGELTELNEAAYQGPMRYVAHALKTAFDYAKREEPFHLILESELDDVSNQKYGFGSSGVVIVAVIASVMAHYNVFISREDLFKLAVITQYKMKETSSGGDLAASIYGGVLSYTRYDAKWLESQIQSVDLVDKEWPDLNITPLPFKDFNMLVGWTQTENKTTPYVKTFLEWGKKNPQDFDRFLFSANDATHLFIDGLQKSEEMVMKIAMEKYRECLNILANQTGLDIETDRLRKLVESANEVGLMAKLSGSGGGDCGIAIGKHLSDEIIEKIDKEWRKNGILLLDVEVTNNEYSF